MAENKAQKQRQTQIPEEAIEGAAGERDIVTFTGYSLGICCKKEVEIPNKNNAETKIEDSKEPKEVFSSDLDLGMTISAKTGGKPVTKETNKDIDR